MSHGNDQQWHNKVILVGGVSSESLASPLLQEVDELSCESGVCVWTELPISLQQPRFSAIAMVIPQMQECQTNNGTFILPDTTDEEGIYVFISL